MRKITLKFNSKRIFDNKKINIYKKKEKQKRNNFLCNSSRKYQMISTYFAARYILDNRHLIL